VFFQIFILDRQSYIEQYGKFGGGEILPSFRQIFVYEKIPLKLSFDPQTLRSSLTLLFTNTSDSTHSIF
jgi:hypothetical protein